ncbi:MAG TPA: hypothetical protein VKF17_08225 [Isosphaeraceae bacterium]|nr:hypothetical protein [Isosphaeraceae bacterium]
MASCAERHGPLANLMIERAAAAGFRPGAGIAPVKVDDSRRRRWSSGTAVSRAVGSSLRT